MPIASNLRVDDAQVRGALERLRLSLPIGGDMKPAFTSIGRIVKTGTQLRFRQQKTPEGKAWKPSQRVEREGGQTLRLTGRLQRSYTYKADHASVEIGSNVVYARIHHFGGIAGRKTFKGEGPPNRSRIPARPALGASRDDIDEIVDTLNGFLGGRWAGR